MPNSKKHPQIAIIGAGISGLAAAHKLSKYPNCQVTIWDADSQPGGVLRTEVLDGCLVENSADMFVTQPATAVELCREIGLESDLIAPNSSNRFSSIVRDGRLERTPAGFSLLAPNQLLSMLRSRLLSPWGKMRFLMEYFATAPKNDQDESLKSFATRHFGTEVFERIVQPLVAGIYSAKADRLSIRATLNRFVEMEKQHGSLIKAARKLNQQKADEQQASGARYGMFLTLKSGFSSLISTLSESLTNVEFKLGQSVDRVQQQNGHWEIQHRQSTEAYDAVILAVAAKHAARLLAPNQSELCEELQKIGYGSLHVVGITCNDANFQANLPQGFGFVVPAVERRKIIAGSFSSNKFAGRAPAGKHLIRAFVGGDHVPDAAVLSDAELQKLAVQELKDLIGFRPDGETGYQVFRWENCMPQYEVGHLDLIAQIGNKIKGIDGLELAGSSYNGVGIPLCIGSGYLAAEEIMRAV